MAPKWNMTKTQLCEWLYKNKIYPFIANTKDPDIIVYKQLIMYRNNKKDPDMLYVEVSKKTKKVLNVYTDFMKFNSFEELKKKYQL